MQDSDTCQIAKNSEILSSKCVGRCCTVSWRSSDCSEAHVSSQSVSGRVSPVVMFCCGTVAATQYNTLQRTAPCCNRPLCSANALPSHMIVHMCAPVLLARTTACTGSRGGPSVSRARPGRAASAVHLQVQQAERHAVQRLQTTDTQQLCDPTSHRTSQKG